MTPDFVKPVKLVDDLSSREERLEEVKGFLLQQKCSPKLIRSGIDHAKSMPTEQLQGSQQVEMQGQDIKLM